MRRPTASFLLANPELVTPVAPWCVRLDNLELGLLLVALPWLAGHGLRRAELERQLSHLGRDLPLGPVYFQRINRTVARLEEIGALHGTGGGRSRRFTLTAGGFAALILNLQVLHADPTLDGREFELKRALVSMWNLTLEGLAQLAAVAGLDPELEAFFDQVEALELWGQPLITDEVVTRALDILGLIESQRRRVRQLLEESAGRLRRLEDQTDPLGGVDLARLADSLGPGAAASLAADPASAAMVRTLATRALPALSLQPVARRYRSYLRYLDELASLYSSELQVVSLEAMRRLAAGKRG